MGIKNELISFRGLTPQIDLTKCQNTGGDTGEGPPIYKGRGYAIMRIGGYIVNIFYIPLPYVTFVNIYNLIINLGDLIAVSDIICIFVLLVVVTETGQGNKFFSKRVDSNLPYCF